MNEGMCFLLTKCLSPAEEKCSSYSVNSNIHWASGFPWSLVSLDSVLHLPLRAAFPKHFYHSKVPGRTLTTASRKVTAVVPRAAAPAKDLVSSTYKKMESWHWPDPKCLVCDWTQDWFWGMLRETKSNCAASVVEERLGETFPVSTAENIIPLDKS